MKFNPTTKRLYTDSGELIKELSCPLRLHWGNLALIRNAQHRFCIDCRHSVLDTAVMTDAELLAVMKTDPGACLSVSASQSNLTIIQVDPKPDSI